MERDPLLLFWLINFKLKRPAFLNSVDAASNYLCCTNYVYDVGLILKWFASLLIVNFGVAYYTSDSVTLM